MCQDYWIQTHVSEIKKERNLSEKVIIYIFLANVMHEITV